MLAWKTVPYTSKRAASLGFAGLRLLGQRGRFNFTWQRSDLLEKSKLIHKNPRAFDPVIFELKDGHSRGFDMPVRRWKPAKLSDLRALQLPSNGYAVTFGNHFFQCVTKIGECCSNAGDRGCEC